MTLKEKLSENIVEQAENAGNYNVFYLEKSKSDFEAHLFCHLQMLLIYLSLQFGKIFVLCLKICLWDDFNFLWLIDILHGV